MFSVPAAFLLVSSLPDSDGLQVELGDKTVALSRWTVILVAFEVDLARALTLMCVNDHVRLCPLLRQEFFARLLMDRAGDWHASGRHRRRVQVLVLLDPTIVDRLSHGTDALKVALSGPRSFFHRRRAVQIDETLRTCVIGDSEQSLLACGLALGLLWRRDPVEILDNLICVAILRVLRHFRVV